MKYLFDTNTCIGYLNSSQPNIVRRVESANFSEIVICSVVLAELIFGAERSSPKHRTQNFDNIEELRTLFSSLPFDDNAALEYGRIRAHLAALGTPIGPNDLMIASIALANNLTLITPNTAKFSRIPALQLEDWQ
ncbi:type II toxin-antitoxin system VapC family toxin [Lacunimicrobium album]